MIEKSVLIGRFGIQTTAFRPHCRLAARGCDIHHGLSRHNVERIACLHRRQVKRVKERSRIAISGKIRQVVCDDQTGLELHRDDQRFGDPDDDVVEAAISSSNQYGRDCVVCHLRLA